jgi:uncharacterized protein YlaI
MSQQNNDKILPGGSSIVAIAFPSQVTLSHNKMLSQELVKGLLDRLHKCDECVERPHIGQGPFERQVKTIIRDAAESIDKSTGLNDGTRNNPYLIFASENDRAAPSTSDCAIGGATTGIKNKAV